MHYRQDNDKYELAALDAEQAFKYLLGLYLIRQISLDDFETRLNRALEDHLGRLMLLALGRQPTASELAWLNNRIQQEQSVYVTGFISTLRNGTESEGRLVWRVGQYAWARDVYIRYTIPESAALLMPYLPGEDCLGRDRCGCWLDVTETDTSYEVYWRTDPIKHNCDVCLAHERSNPYVFSKGT